MLWLGKTVLGTTDTAPDDRAAEPSPFREEVEFILNEAGQYLSKPPTRADVLSVRVGLRPLVRPPQAEDAHTQTKALWREHTVLTVARQQPRRFETGRKERVFTYTSGLY